MKVKNIAVLLSVMGMPLAALATNGMNMEGYGPIATGMGGASMAFDNGAAGMANNPATLALMKDGTSRLDIAVGVLGPKVGASNVSGSQNSSATSFLMPAGGWVKKSNGLTYGVGVFAQGGMGAEYDGNSALDQSGRAGVSMGGGLANTDSQKQRSELGVGRLIFPLAYDVSSTLSIGGSLDYVWGGLDILWSMDARNFLGSMTNVTDPSGLGKDVALGGMIGGRAMRAQTSGSLVNAFVGAFDTSGAPAAGPGNNGAFNNFYWGHFAFSNDNDFSQATKGSGWAGKLGFVYKLNNQLSIGGTYHAKTRMSDFTGRATMTFKVDTTAAAGGAVVGRQIPVSSSVKVLNFQWPETYGIGFAYQANDRWFVAADWKRLNWADVMKSFRMELTADGTQADALAAGFAGTTLNFTYPQNWKNQDVIHAGASYAWSDALTVRGGVNLSSNPVPDGYVNYLFPATIKTHYMFGLGYRFDKVSSVDFSMTYAPKVSVTESQTETNNLGTTPATSISHSQTNWQLMYSHRF